MREGGHLAWKAESCRAKPELAGELTKWEEVRLHFHYAIEYHMQMKSAKIWTQRDIRFCTVWQVYQQQKWLWIAADDCRRVVGILIHLSAHIT